MTFYWKNLEAHILNLKDSEEWRLFVDYDEHDYVYIFLEKNDRTYECAWSNFYWQGNEHTQLSPYHIAEHYNNVVHCVYELIRTEKAEYIDLCAIQDQLIETYWRSLYDQRIVDCDTAPYFSQDRE